MQSANRENQRQVRGGQMDEGPPLLAPCYDFLPYVSSWVQIYLVNTSYFKLMIAIWRKFPEHLGFRSLIMKIMSFKLLP